MLYLFIEKKQTKPYIACVFKLLIFDINEYNILFSILFYSKFCQPRIISEQIPFPK